MNSAIDDILKIAVIVKGLPGAMMVSPSSDGSVSIATLGGKTLNASAREWSAFLSQCQRTAEKQCATLPRVANVQG
jgi:hypothetical protein